MPESARKVPKERKNSVPAVSPSRRKQKTYEYYRDGYPFCDYPTDGCGPPPAERRCVEKPHRKQQPVARKERGDLKAEGFDPPPPPNGRDDLWELQFCRWWGWNWVRKRDDPAGYRNGGQCGQTQLQPTHSPQAKDRRQVQTKNQKSGFLCCGSSKKKPPPPPIKPGKELRNICRCIVGMKSPRKVPSNNNLQKVFDTPSNSVIECDNYTCGYMNEEVKSYSHSDLDKTPSKQKRNEESEKLHAWTKQVNCCSSSSFETNCRYTGKRYASSTEESVEYLTLRLQHVTSNIDCQCRGPMPRTCVKNVNDTVVIHNATQTIEEEGPPCNSIETQTFEEPTEEKQKRRKCRCKKPRVCIVACPCSHYCKDCALKSKEKKVVHQEEAHEIHISKPEDAPKDFEQQPITTYPVNIVQNKLFSKFGHPSKNYPWLQSDTNILDEITSLKCRDEFSSPFTGKKYDLAAPMFKEEKDVSLPEPIDITNHVNYLKYLESITKPNVENRIVVDAVCDAILGHDLTTPSIFLNEFTYQTSPLNIFDDIKTSPENTENNINHFLKFEANETENLFLKNHFNNREKELDDLDKIMRRVLGDENEFNKVNSNKNEDNKTPRAFTVSDDYLNELNKTTGTETDKDRTKANINLPSPTFTRTGLLCIPASNKRNFKQSSSSQSSVKCTKRTKSTHDKNSVEDGVIRKAPKLTKTINRKEQKEKGHTELNVSKKNYFFATGQNDKVNSIDVDYKPCLNSSKPVPMSNFNGTFEQIDPKDPFSEPCQKKKTANLKSTHFMEKDEIKKVCGKQSGKKWKKPSGTSLIPVRKREMHSRFSKKVLFN